MSISHHTQKRSLLMVISRFCRACCPGVGTEQEVIKSHRRSLDEENYKEALASAFKVWAPPAVGSDLKAILEDPCADVKPSSDDFWILVAALKVSRFSFLLCSYVLCELLRLLPMQGKTNSSL